MFCGDLSGATSDLPEGTILAKSMSSLCCGKDDCRAKLKAKQAAEVEAAKATDDAVFAERVRVVLRAERLIP
jgi:hypothetical protein